MRCHLLMKYYLSPILANSLKIQASQSYFPAPCHLLLLYPCIIYGCFAESIYYSLNYNPFKQGWRFLLGQLPLSSAVCIYDMIMTDLICHSWHNLCHHLLSDKLCENATDEKKKKSRYFTHGLSNPFVQVSRTVEGTEKRKPLPCDYDQRPQMTPKALSDGQ